MTGTRIALRRTVLARLASGAVMQAVLTLLVILLPIGGISSLARSDGGRAAGLFIAWVVVIAIWARGLAGYAEADEQGVRWRYYLRHDIAWSEVERLTLAVRSFGFQGMRHEIRLRARGRTYFVTPACGRGQAQVEFAWQLVQLAQARGVAIDQRWGAAFSRGAPAG